jgi:hypothetical protein
MLNTKKKMNYFNKLIANNTGVSSKNFFLVVITIIGCILLIVPAFALTFEMIINTTISTSIEGFASYIAAVGTLFASAGITKAWSERYEYHQPHHQFNEEENEEVIPNEE